MADSQTVQIEGIGAVLLERSTRARRIIITVRPGRGVRVAVPRRTSFKSALEFVRVKKSWIKKHLARIQQYEKQKKDFSEIFFAIDKTAARKKIIGRLNELARQHGFTYKKVSIRNQRTRWGSCSGKRNISLNMKLVALPQELSDYVILHELHGFNYNKVSIRNQRTRWGSCSGKRNISLNMKLVALPQELSDYVILHELVH